MCTTHGGRIMFAVVETGGKQYTVQVGDTLKVEKLNAEVGDVLKLDKVLLVGREVGTLIGQPIVKGALVEVHVLAQELGDKVLVFKKRRRKDSKTLKGHRQHFTLLKVQAITV